MKNSIITLRQEERRASLWTPSTSPSASSCSRNASSGLIRTKPSSVVKTHTRPQSWCESTAAAASTRRPSSPKPTDSGWKSSPENRTLGWNLQAGDAELQITRESRRILNSSRCRICPWGTSLLLGAGVAAARRNSSRRATRSALRPALYTRSQTTMTSLEKSLAQRPIWFCLPVIIFIWDCKINMQ